MMTTTAFRLSLQVTINVKFNNKKKGTYAMNYIDPKITIWCDMDGVIAVYESDGFKGDNPPFLTPNSHYFRHCTPDDRIIQALKLLHEIYHVKIKIISNVAPELKTEHTNDKEKWLKKHLPFLNTDDDFKAITVPKVDYVKKIKKTKALTSKDVLISDFNNDLKPWSAAGGTAIKYANGINNPHSHDGNHIPEKATTKQIANQLIDTLYEISKHN